MNPSRRKLLASAAAPFLFLPARAASARTNVVMFMTDDHGAWAFGAGGCSTMATPALDKLAREGAMFTRAYACTPVCSPSRMTYLTGRLPSHHGVQDYLKPADSAGPSATRWLNGQPTYSEPLAKAGYMLGMVGKWHMGIDEQAQAGFSYWATIPGGGGPYRNVTFTRNGQPAKAEFKTDGMTEFALDFLDQQKNSGADKPFYLLMPFYAPHTPYDYQPEQDRKHYEGSAFPCFPDKPMHPRQNPGLAKDHRNRNSKHSYSALVSGVDRSVGAVLRKLEEMGRRENTLVIFTADQGYNCGHHGVWGKGNGTHPFNLYEESIRVPMIWNHPGRIRPGQTVTRMISSYDYFPTILDYLGVKAPPDAKRIGRSYAGLLSGRTARWENRLYFEYSYVRGVRTETMKYIERTAEWPSELYDLEKDPGEERNVIADPAYGRQLAALKSDLERWFAKAGAPKLADWRGTTKQDLQVYRAVTP